MKHKTIIIIILTTWLLISIPTIILYRYYANIAIERFELLNGSNQWYEMISRNCGYEDNDKDNYCRGFSNGYDYASFYFEIDCITRELYPNEDNPNLFKPIN